MEDELAGADEWPVAAVACSVGRKVRGDLADQIRRGEAGAAVRRTGEAEAGSEVLVLREGAERDVYVAIGFDGDVAPLHRLDFVGARDRDRLREGFAGVRRPAEVQFVGARTGEAGPADVDIPVVRSAGAIDL